MAIGLVATRHTLRVFFARDAHFKNKQNLVTEVQGDPHLFNQYGVFLVNPKRCPHVKIELGNAFINYLISPEGQKVIASYRVQGKQLFHPDANKRGA